LLLIVLLCSAPKLFAGEASGTVQSTRLYTPPDPGAHGGIRAQLLLPNQPLLDAFAMPTHDYLKVYRGQVTAEGNGFHFSGLPVGKYDLMLLYEDSFYEGFTLSREPDTLTDQDRAAIKAVVTRSVPFFDTKQIHRSAGAAGRDGKARGVLQELRTGKTLAQSADELTGSQIRRCKLVLLQDVGKVGWQLVETRELARTEVAPAMRKGLLAHSYNPQLSGIRVTDAVKDLGPLNLKRQTAQ
jgi:hypothetical protein